MYIVQSVLNHLKNINHSIRPYVISLILSSGRKNCAAMSKANDIPDTMLYAFLAGAKNYVRDIEVHLIKLANLSRIKGLRRALVLDPTMIIKHYAKKMAKLCYDRSGCIKKVAQGLVPVYASVTDENVSIPLCIDFWIQEKIVGKKRYKSKAKITQELIDYLIKKGLEFDYVVLDGAFAIPDMFAFFKREGLEFIMRIARNRKIKTADGLSAQLKKHPALMLMRNLREKMVMAQLNDDSGDTYFLTAQKRKTLDGEWEVVFVVSNMNLVAKEQIAAYDLRWPIEKMIRTTKQKLGAGQCQAIESPKQQAHIMAGFLAYGILNLALSDKKKISVDALINQLREFHFDDLIGLINNSIESDPRHNVGPISISPQKSHQNLSLYPDTMSLLVM